MMLRICNSLVVHGMVRRFAVSACSKDDGLRENISATWRPEHNFHGGTLFNDDYNEYLRRRSGEGDSLLVIIRLSRKE